MRIYKAKENVLDTIEDVAINHKIVLSVQTKLNRQGDEKLIAKDDEGNQWIDQGVFCFLNEFIIDMNLISKEQAEQINEYAHLFEDTTNLDWLVEKFNYCKMINDELILEGQEI